MAEWLLMYAPFIGGLVSALAVGYGLAVAMVIAGDMAFLNGDE